MKKIFILVFTLSFSLQLIFAQNKGTASTGPIPKMRLEGNHQQVNPSQNTLLETAYGYSNNQYYTLSMPIPAGTPFTFLTQWISPNFASSMVWPPFGNDCYITELGPPAALYQMDSETGSVTLLGNISGMSGDMPNGISYNSYNNTYYLISSTNFYSFDVSTRAATLIGPFNTGGLMIDLCFNQTGVCYAYDIYTDNAYIINITTGNATLLGPLGYDANYGQGMSFDYETQTIYLSAFNNTTLTGQLRTMNPVTGMTTLITDWGLEQIAPFALPGVRCWSPVGFASNPSPPFGETNIPITGTNLSWTNGNYTINVEVWFGVQENVVKVYDGPAITSWALDTLLYGTQYRWKIICEDTTCEVTYGPTWMFTTEQDPNLVNLFCDDFEEGSGNWTITNDGGTCVWDISTLARPYTMPSTAMGNVFAADEDICGNGTTLLSTATLNTSIDFTNPAPGISYVMTWLEFDNDWNTLQSADEAHIEVSTDGGANWTGVWDKIGFDIRNSHETADLSAFISQAEVRLRLRSVQPGWDWWWAVDNFCIYGEYATPVELTSFAAIVSERNVELNWSTATETNNQGFDIERKTSNRPFAKIGYVPGFGTSTDLHSYSFTDDNITVGSYFYRLKQIDFDGSFAYSPEVEAEVKTPNVFSLEQNYPNPFNPNTVISYQLPVIGNVTLKVYDVLGNEVATLVNEEQEPGVYEIEFSTSSGIRNLVSGIYFYQLKADSFIETKKMILLK